MLENNRMTRQIEEYVAYKRSLGYVIKIEAQELRRFAKYTREIGYDGSVTEELAMRWSSLNDNFTRKYMARRLETLHTFAVYISAFDEQAQIPRNGVFGKAHTRTDPYIYTDEEVLSLMSGADSLFSPDGIRSSTVASAIGLMHATGIRVSELTSLRIADVQLEKSCLFICNSKFKKDRLVPLHPTVIAKLLEYRVFIENKIGVRGNDDYFFVTSYGRRFNTRTFEYAFQLIRPLVFCDKAKQPRLYDLRHTFACNTVKRWNEAGEDVNRKLYLLSTYMGHIKPADTYWYLSATPELPKSLLGNSRIVSEVTAHEKQRHSNPSADPKYFLQWLMAQRNVSPETIKSYRDTFRLYLRYIETHKGVAPSKMSVAQFDADHILEFLSYLGKERGNSPKTVNSRLAALHSFIKYLIFEVPEYSGLLNRSLMVPFRKAEKRQMEFLTEDEFVALKNACNTNTVLGCRDMLMLMLLYNTGVRVSELVGLKLSDLHIDSRNTTAYIRVHGKGRKERHVPLWKNTVKYLADYIRDHCHDETSYLFANCVDGNLTRSGVRYRLDCLQKKAAEAVQSLNKKKITPHTFRHTTTLRMLQSGVDISSIAIWLGHESILTTHKYMEADLEMKRQTLEKMGEPSQSSYHFSANASILSFLNSL